MRKEENDEPELDKGEKAGKSAKVWKKASPLKPWMGIPMWRRLNRTVHVGIMRRQMRRFLTP